MRKPLPTMDETIARLSGHISNMAEQACPNGYLACDSAPGDYYSLVKSYSIADELGRPRLVWNGASDQTIYTHHNVNFAMRAWHDSVHYACGLSFSYVDELEVAYRQASTVVDLDARTYLVADTAGQTIYARYNNGEFPADQKAFVLDLIRNVGATSYQPDVPGMNTRAAWDRDMAMIRRYIANGKPRHFG